MVEQLVPANARTEAFTWLTGSIAFGQAVAVILAGRLTDAHGSTYGFLVPMAATALALAVLLALRAKLAPKAPSRIVNASVSAPVSAAAPVSTPAGARVPGTLGESAQMESCKPWRRLACGHPSSRQTWSA